MSNATRLPTSQVTKIELAVHHAWGLAKSYYLTSWEAYEVADQLTKAGWTVSIKIG